MPKKHLRRPTWPSDPQDRNRQWWEAFNRYWWGKYGELPDAVDLMLAHHADPPEGKLPPLLFEIWRGMERLRVTHRLVDEKRRRLKQQLQDANEFLSRSLPDGRCLRDHVDGLATVSRRDRLPRFRPAGDRFIRELRNERQGIQNRIDRLAEIEEQVQKAASLFGHGTKVADSALGGIVDLVATWIKNQRRNANGDRVCKVDWGDVELWLRSRGWDPGHPNKATTQLQDAKRCYQKLLEQREAESERERAH